MQAEVLGFILERILNKSRVSLLSFSSFWRVNWNILDLLNHRMEGAWVTEFHVEERYSLSINTCSGLFGFIWHQLALTWVRYHASYQNWGKKRIYKRVICFKSGRENYLPMSVIYSTYLTPTRLLSLRPLS